MKIFPISDDNLALKTLIDSVDSSTTYIGEAQPGAATSSGVWRIQKLITSGTVTTIYYADGDTKYDNVWDNRTSLTYT